MTVVVPIARGSLEPAQSGGRPCEWAATGRSGGVSGAPYDALNLAGYLGDDPAAVHVNRVRVAELLGLPGERLAVMEAVHGSDVAEVDGPGGVCAVDALVTRQPDLAIMALGADCLPMALVGMDAVTIAVAHCGWRGLAGDVVGAVVGAVRDHGTQVRLVILGPAVCGYCYPVPAGRIRELVARTSPGVAGASVVTCADGQPGIDVRAGAIARLGELGIAAPSIVSVGGCTFEDAGMFSFRRDGLTGRQGLAVCTRGGQAL